MGVFLAALVFALAFQGSRGLWERDEGRYTNIAVQMVASGDYLIPALNDGTPHLAKPPLTYWAIAGGLSLLGWNEWGARLFSALAFAGTVGTLFSLGRRITPERAWLPPAVYATSVLPYLAANIVTTDTLLTLWETLAVLGFLAWWRSQGAPRHSGPLVLMWAAFGLAFLTKGPPGLLPLLAIVAFLACIEGWRGTLRLFNPGGLLVFLLVGVGWYVVVAVLRPDAPAYWLGHEVLGRVTSDVHHRNAQWYKPFLIYLPVVLFGSLPWSFPLLRGLAALPRTVLRRSWWSQKRKEDPVAILLLLWFALPFLVFCFSRSRLPLYILPLFVPLALAVSRVSRPLTRPRRAACALAAWVLVLLTTKYAASRWPYAQDSRAMAQALSDARPSVPNRIVFVDTEPAWGLRLYLESEVAQAWTRPGPDLPGNPRRLLTSELQAMAPDSLFVVNQHGANQVLVLMQNAGHAAHIIGTHGAWAFIAP